MSEAGELKMSEQAFAFGLIFVAVYLFVIILYGRRGKSVGEMTFFSIAFGFVLLLLELIGWTLVSELFGI